MSVNNTQRALLANYLLGQGSSSTQGKNYVKNSIAINGTDNVTASGVGSSVTKNTTTPLTGISDFSIALGNNTTGYIEWSLDSLDRSLTNQNCQLTFDYKITSIGSVVQGEVYVGGVLSVSQIIPATPTTGTFSINVPCGDLSGATTVRISNATGNSGASVLNVANVNYGKATNIGTVQQARLVGTVKVTGCASAWSTTSTTYASLGTQTGCSYAVTGEALAPTTNIAAIRFASLPPGEYKIEYDGAVASNVLGKDAFFQFTDGTNTARENSLIYSSAGALNTSNLSQTILYTSPQSNITFELRAKVSSGGTAALYGTNTYPSVFRVYQFPSSSQQAVSSAQADYDWTAYGTTSDFTGFGTVSNIQLQHKRLGSDLLIRGKFTSGTSTATEARIALPSGLTSAGTGIIPSIQVAGKVNTNVSASTYFSGGTVLIEPSVAYITFGRESSTANGLTKVNGSTMTVLNDVVSFTATIPISGWNMNQRAPVLVGSVTSNSSGALRTEYGKVSSTCSSSPCTITEQSGSWVTSITYVPTGNYTINYNSGTFAAAPTCFCVNNGTSTRNCSIATPTTTSFNLRTWANANTSEDNPFSFFCIGPR